MSFSRRGAAALLLVAGALLVAPATSRAGDDEPKGPHLEFRRTYAEALLESRVRGMPLFVSRHKDF
jgi:hypothetical protein